MVTSDQIILIVETLDSQGYIRKKKINGDWYTVYCPFHKDGKERKASCGVLIRPQIRNGKQTDPGLWHCFTCGHSKGLVASVDEIMKLNKAGITGKDWLIDNIPDIELDDTVVDTDNLVPSSVLSVITNKYAIDYISSKLNKKENNYVTEEELEQYRYTVPYMYDRGLTDEIIERYDIGFDANHIPEHKNKPVPCVTFPVKDRLGRCLFIFRRSIEGRYFNYPEGVEKPVYGLYELKKGTDTVVICESAFNMMTCIRHGYEAVALFGTGNPYQIQQLKELGVNRFILALDPDDAGQRGMNKLRKQLSRVAFISQIYGIPKGKDLNDLTEEEFDQLWVE